MLLETFYQRLFCNFSAYAYIDDCGDIIKHSNQNCQKYMGLAFNYLNLFVERVTVKSNIN